MTACISPSMLRPAARVLKTLIARGLTVVTAESCTAGLVAASLSMAEGAGDVLHGSFVTYTKDAKHRALGIPAALLRREGAVARRVASDMLRGALRHSTADIAVAVTGVLGPKEDEDGNPVGLVYIACQRRGHRPTILRMRYGKRDPDLLRQRVVRDALTLLNRETRKRVGNR